MDLKDEIELNRDFVSKNEEVLLSLLHTGQLLEQASTALLGQYDLTPTQFNALLIVRDYESGGIKQSELARRLLINRASTGTLIDALERRKLLHRRSVEGDRRAYHLHLSSGARALLRRMLDPYYERVEAVFSTLAVKDKSTVLRSLTKVRTGLRAELERLANDD